MNTSDLKAYIEKLSIDLRAREEYVVDIYNKFRIRENSPEKKGLLSFHNTIGSKNNTFIDSVRTNFLNPEDYIAQWIDGLCKQYGNKSAYRAPQYKYIILEMLKVPECRDYIYKFLERSFYRHMIERIRTKPDEALWEIWFGENKIFWGLFITPVERNGIWKNDVSEIRRVAFNYWTIGHVLQSGLLDPENNELIQFRSLQAFCEFYKSILIRLSASEYEKELMNRYLVYVLKSNAPMEEPLLIPELRFAGKEKKHLYRLDFTILNIYTQQYIGFEISPQSTHMAVQKTKDKSQIQLNRELSEKWENESRKRNAYFRSYNISTVTFTDSDIADIDGCFSVIEEYLQARDAEIPTLIKAEYMLNKIIGF